MAKKFPIAKRKILELSAQQGVSQLEEAFLEMLIQRGGAANAYDVGDLLGFRELVGDDHSAAFARAVANALIKRGIIEQESSWFFRVKIK